jgi:hypothetical protein
LRKAVGIGKQNGVIGKLAQRQGKLAAGETYNEF